MVHGVEYCTNIHKRVARSKELTVAKTVTKIDRLRPEGSAAKPLKEQSREKDTAHYADMFGAMDAEVLQCHC